MLKSIYLFNWILHVFAWDGHLSCEPCLCGAWVYPICKLSQNWYKSSYIWTTKGHRKFQNFFEKRFCFAKVTLWVKEAIWFSITDFYQQYSSKVILNYELSLIKKYESTESGHFHMFLKKETYTWAMACVKLWRFWGRVKKHGDKNCNL